MILTITVMAAKETRFKFAFLLIWKLNLIVQIITEKVSNCCGLMVCEPHFWTSVCSWMNSVKPKQIYELFRIYSNIHFTAFLKILFSCYSWIFEYVDEEYNIYPQEKMTRVQTFIKAENLPHVNTTASSAKHCPREVLVHLNSESLEHRLGRSQKPKLS